MLRVNHNGEYASGFLSVGGYRETYINNPALNYFGTNGTLSLNLDPSIKKLLPNASLRLTDMFTYTPLPPGFVNPAAGTSPDASPQNIYAQGFLGYRTNNVINNGTVSTAYATTESTSLNASYSYAVIRFGSAASTQGLSLFNSTTQIGTVGGAAQLSRLDTLNIRYAYTQTEFTPSSSTSRSPSSSFIIQNPTIGWERVLTPNLTAQLGGGGILISSRALTYSVNVALIMNSLNNSATINYSHTAFPGIAGRSSGGILIGDVFSLSAIQRINQHWQLAERASYAHTSGASSNPVTYDSFAVGGEIQYWMTSIWSTSLSYTYTKFSNELGSVKTDFDRQVIALSVIATWE